MKTRIPAALLTALIGISTGLGSDNSALTDLSERLHFVDRKAQTYTLKFTARPDKDRFQIQRLPTAKWPKRANFYVGLTETSADKQFRLDGFVEKEAKTKDGSIVDASELNVTHLPSATKHQLVRNIPVTIPTYFAELRELKTPDKTFYVKEGETFSLPSDVSTKDGEKKTKYKIAKVSEDSVSITLAGAKDDTTRVEIPRK